MLTYWLWLEGQRVAVGCRRCHGCKKEDERNGPFYFTVNNKCPRDEQHKLSRPSAVWVKTPNDGRPVDCDLLPEEPILNEESDQLPRDSRRDFA